MTTRVREARLPLHEAPEEGAVRLLDVGGLRVGLFRVADDFHALADRCPHRGAPICSGRVVAALELTPDGPELGAPASVIRCPWHKWEFEIETGRCLVDERLRVRRYAVRVEGDELVVALDRPDEH